MLRYVIGIVLSAIITVAALMAASVAATTLFLR